MTYKLNVENIKCNGWAHSIKSRLGKLKGLESVDVNVEPGIIQLDITENKTLEAVIEKLHPRGYPQSYKGTGMTTAASYINCMIGKVTS